ncbi:MAG TPA: zf-HC2 domain-containing protein [Thermoleophilaceae bacterium]
MIEPAPLRPVPRHPAGPVEPGPAADHVAARLPQLDPLPRDALTLVTLSGRTREEAAARLEVSPEELAVALARARKELRRSLWPLPGSGWCERAERLVSDRLDGPLDDVGAARLGVHLRNCPRCVDHERRLVQAIDGLVAGLAGEPEPAPAPVPAAPAPLRLAEARDERELPSAVGLPPIPALPFGIPVAPGAAAARATELPGVLATVMMIAALALAAWAGLDFPLL